MSFSVASMVTELASRVEGKGGKKERGLGKEKGFQPSPFRVLSSPSPPLPRLSQRPKGNLETRARDI